MKLAVAGDPVAHSASPALFRAMFAAHGVDGTYDAVRVSSGDGARAFERLRDEGYDGLNVTTPLKEEAFAYARAADDLARASRSVNVLLLRERRGANTDGAGASAALRAAGVARDARVLVLGLGPTGRAATLAFRDAGMRVRVWNRTSERARSFADAHGVGVWSAGAHVDAAFSTLPPDAHVGDLEATLRAVVILVDANYGPRATLGRALGRADARDGRAMLEASARASYALFTRTGDTSPP